MFYFLMLIWYILTIVQSFLNIGTAYRLTKAGGDNGVSLFGWMFLMSLASFIPGLGIYLWISNKDTGSYDYNSGSGGFGNYGGSGSSGSAGIYNTPSWANPNNQNNIPVQDGSGNEICPRCNTNQKFGRDFCVKCGVKFNRG